MNIIKRLLNVISIIGWLFVAGGVSGSIYASFTGGHNKNDLIYFGLFFVGLVFIFNYVLFQNISTWNKVEKNNL